MSLYNDKTELRRILALLLINILAFIFILLNLNGVYWDDWALFGQDNTDWSLQFIENGGWLVAVPLHYLFLNMIDSVFVYHFAVFLLFFGCSLYLYKLLNFFDSNRSESNILIAILMSLIPVNSAKITMICLGYTACYFMFFLGMYHYFVNGKNKLFKMLSLCLMFLSYNTNSLLVFHYAFLIPIFWSIGGRTFNLKKMNIKTNLRNHILIIILPILFFIVKKLFFIPSGPYAGYYNEITLLEGFSGLYGFTLSVWANYAHQASVHWFLLIIIFVLVSIILKFGRISWPVKSNKENTIYLFIGILMYVGGAFPYTAVGKSSAGYFVETRNEFLLPLGVGIMAYALISFVGSNFGRLNIKIFQKGLVPMIIAYLVSVNIQTYYVILENAFKKNALVFLMKKDKNVRESTSFTFGIDGFQEKRGIKDTYAFYELSGMARLAYGDSTRFISYQNDPHGDPNPNGSPDPITLIRPQYNYGEYKVKNYEYHLVLKKRKELKYNDHLNYLFDIGIGNSNSLRVQNLYLSHFDLVSTKYKGK